MKAIYGSASRVGVMQVVRALLAMLVLLSPQRGSAQDAYLARMPTPAQVVAGLSGADPLDLAAKRAGAMYQLRDIVWTLAEGRQYTNKLTGQELALSGAYVREYGRISAPIIASFDPRETQRLGWQSPRAKWFGARTRYETSTVFQGQLLERFFPADFREHFRAVKARQHSSTPSPLEAARQPLSQLPASPSALQRIWNMSLEWFVLAVALFVLFLACRSMVRSYNALQAWEQQIAHAKSTISNVLDKKSNLVNELAQVVRERTQNENFVHLKVNQDNVMAAYAQAGAVYSSIQQAAERFPNLKSDPSFQALSQAIQQCEHEVLYYRNQYDAVITQYNTYGRQFPRVLYSRLVGFSVREHLNLDVSNARETAKPVQLASDNARRLDHVLQLPPADPRGSAPPALSGATPGYVVAGGGAPQLGSGNPRVNARGGRTEALSALPSVSIRCLSGPLGGHSVAVGAGVIVGREAPAAQVVVADPQVSSAHAWIGMKGDALIFVDNGSTNGSVVNGASVRAGEEVPLKRGDQISLGRANGVAFVVEQA